jgi:hypothetical protein
MCEVEVREPWALSYDDLTTQLADAYRISQQALARVAVLAAAADVNAMPKRDGATSTISWLIGRLGCSRGEAAHAVELGKALAKHRETLEATVAALSAGRIGVQQARIIAKTITGLPSQIGPQARKRCADLLTGLAADDTVAPHELEAHRQAILQQVAPEVAEKALRKQVEDAERSAFARRGITLSPCGEGEYRVHGTLPTEAAAIFRAAMDPLCAPGMLTPPADPDQKATADAEKTADGRPDTGAGTDSQAGKDGGAGKDGAVRDSRAGKNRGDAGKDGAGRDSGGRDSGGRDSGKRDGGGRDGADDGDGVVRDRRSAAARRADALTEICSRVLAQGELPDNGGERPHVVITMDFEQLRQGLGGAVLDTGEHLSAATARRLACDALTIPAVLGGQSQPLDLGRARRLIDGPLRRALVLRDGGCSFPGCDRPASWCQGHHVIPWSEGGKTSLETSALVCGFHHRLIHHSDWTVHIGTDGHPWFIPPHHLDPDQRPRRNHIHRRC